MIKRLSKHNDLKDLIKSCPSGVIDDIYAIEYYIQGHNETIQGTFTKKETMLEVILPSSDLETLPNGILMRRAYYKVVDASYPDGYYNLEFEDNMNVWLGEVESEEPIIPEYVTEEELAETLGDYATQEWVEDKGYLTEHQSLEGYATEQWVSSQQFATTSYVSNQISGVQAWVSSQSYLTSVTVSNYITESVIENLGFATESWVQNQGYLTSHQDLSSYATISWVSSQDYASKTWVTENLPSLTGYATISYVDSQVSGVKDWVGSQSYLTSASLSNYITESAIENLGFATESWVQSQGYYAPETAHAPVEYHDLSEDSDIDIEYQDYNPKTMRLIEPGEDGFVIGGISVLDGDPTLEYVDKIQGVYFGKNASGSYTVGLYQYAVTDKNGSIIYPESFYEFVTSNQLNSYATQKWVNNKGYATHTWVQSQGYLNSASLSGYATEQWVSSQQFATESWVSSQGYLTSHQDLSSYATEAWVQSQGYLTSHQDLTGYATESWATSQFLEESKVWTGTSYQWSQLTSEQKAFYTIALVIE